MSEIRADAESGAWTIVAPARGRRPSDAAAAFFPPPAGPGPERPSFDPQCPFCPGNEAMLLDIVDETPGPGPAGWQARAVPNKYAALAGAPAAGWAPKGPYAQAPAAGRHEVVVESPRHDAELDSMAPAELERVLAMYRRRFAVLAGAPDVAAVVLFRNRGEWAGASLHHPHAQAAGLAAVPPEMAARHRRVREYHHTHGTCPVCDALAFETAEGTRMVAETDAFAAFVPFAARVPFELRVVPRDHGADFAALDEAARRGLAGLLHDLLGRLNRRLRRPPYNFWIDSLPLEAMGAPYAHWSLRLLPVLTRPAGFELATGVLINPSSPERDAAELA